MWEIWKWLSHHLVMLNTLVGNNKFEKHLLLQFINEKSQIFQPMFLYRDGILKGTKQKGDLKGIRWFLHGTPSKKKIKMEYKRRKTWNKKDR